MQHVLHELALYTLQDEPKSGSHVCTTITVRNKMPLAVPETGVRECMIQIKVCNKHATAQLPHD